MGRGQTGSTQEGAAEGLGRPLIVSGGHSSTAMCSLMTGGWRGRQGRPGRGVTGAPLSSPSKALAVPRAAKAPTLPGWWYSSRSSRDAASRQLPSFTSCTASARPAGAASRRGEGAGGLGMEVRKRARWIVPIIGAFQGRRQTTHPAACSAAAELAHPRQAQPAGPSSSKGGGCSQGTLGCISAGDQLVQRIHPGCNWRRPSCRCCRLAGAASAAAGGTSLRRQWGGAACCWCCCC